MITLDQIGHLLQQHYGFALTPEFLHSLKQSLNRRSQHAGKMQLEDYGAIIKNSPEELRELVDELVVGETFFFRYPESFAALTDWVSRMPRRPLRILSLACSTGEEPYSIAMTLLDAGLDKEEFHLEGRDLSATALAKARAGCFTSNSFRGREGDWRERYFHSGDSVWEIRQELRETVRFQEGNLLELAEHDAWDIIFCRNVLIYFSAEQHLRVVRSLKAALGNDGLLFLGSAEPVTLLTEGWALAPYSMAFACMKAKAAKLAVARKIVSPPVAPRPRVQNSRPKIRETPVKSLAPPRSELEQAETLADGGRLEEAHEVLVGLLKQEPENSGAHFLMGVVEEARGYIKAAESSYRKVLFLDPLHHDALVHMALLLHSQGRHQIAEQMSRRAAQNATTP